MTLFSFAEHFSNFLTRNTAIKKVHYNIFKSLIWEDTNQNFIWFHISLSMKKENKEKCVSFASCKVKKNNRVTLKLCFELALMHMELFFIFFFPWFQYDVFLCKVFCVSYLINSWGIFFLKKKYAAASFVSNTKSYLCEISKTQSREKCKRYECVHVCVCKYEKPCVWSKGDASAV